MTRRNLTRGLIFPLIKREGSTMDEFPGSIRFRMEGETFTGPFSFSSSSSFSPYSIVEGWLRGSRESQGAGRSVSRFSARQSVTFPRIKFESIFLSVILVTPAYNNVGGKRSRGEREEIVPPLIIHSLSLSLSLKRFSCNRRTGFFSSLFLSRRPIRAKT